VGRAYFDDYSVIMGNGDGDECDDDAACSANGRCTAQGTCQCTVTWAGRNCTDQNHLYFHSFSLVFYALMTVSMVQLILCIRYGSRDPSGF
jgi:hypothetical protein